MWRRGNWRDGFGQRLGQYGPKTKQALSNRDTLWSHAVSVGEVNLCTQIIQAPREQLRFALGTDVTLSHLHPVLYLLQQAFEQADPVAFVPRITRSAGRSPGRGLIVCDVSREPRP